MTTVVGSSQAGGTGANPLTGGAGQPASPQAGAESGVNPLTGSGDPTTEQNTPVSVERAAEIQRENQALRRRLKEQTDKETAATAQAEAARIAAADADGVRKEYAKAQEALTATKAELATERLERKVERVAAKLGITDANIEAAMTLLKAKAGAIETDADGQPTNAESLVRDLIKTYPFLAVRTTGGTADAGARSAGQPQGTNTQMNALIRNKWRG